MMAVETEVTAADVACELVATKIAFVQVFENLSGTVPTLHEPEAKAVNAWAHESPIPLPDDLEPIWKRANEITEQIMQAVGRYLIRCA